MAKIVSDFLAGKLLEEAEVRIDFSRVRHDRAPRKENQFNLGKKNNGKSYFVERSKVSTERDKEVGSH